MSAPYLKEKASSRNILRSLKSVTSSAKSRRDLLVFMGDMHRDPLSAVPEPASRPKSTSSFASRNSRNVFSAGKNDAYLGSTPLFHNVDSKKVLDLHPVLS